jgi:hypothetical protein
MNRGMRLGILLVSAVGLATLGAWYLHRSWFSNDYREWVDCIEKSVDLAGKANTKYRTVWRPWGPPLWELQQRRPNWELHRDKDPGSMSRADAVILSLEIEHPTIRFGGMARPEDVEMLKSPELAPFGTALLERLRNPHAYWRMRVCYFGHTWSAVASPRLRTETIELK